jgi:class 3 adenylate cyclase
MFTDMVGYTSLSRKNEDLAIQLLEEHRSLVRPFFQKHNGREVKTIGDAFMVEFASALEAVRCAFDIQQSMHEMNGGRLPEKQVQLRIGVHVGDVIHSQSDVHGDAVNVAERIESLAMPGSICVSEQIYDQIKNKFEFPLISIGKRELKNVGEPLEVYKVVVPWEKESVESATQLDARRIAVLPFVSMSPASNIRKSGGTPLK